MTKSIASFGCEVFASYGMSECCGKISMSMIDEAAVPPSPELIKRITSSGRAFGLIDLRVVDEAGRDSVDAPGEVWCRGEALFRDGYHNSPETTKAVFSAGWFATGDLADMGPDGYISVVGRRSCLSLRFSILHDGLGLFPGADGVT